MDLIALYEKIFSALVTGGFQSIIDAAYDVMRMPISAHDSAFNLLAAAPRKKIGDFFWDVCLETGVFPRETIMLFYDQGFMEAAQKSAVPYYVDWGDCAERPRIQGVIRLNNVVEGYVTVYCPKEIFTPDYFKATTMIVNACAIEMQRSNNRNLSENPLFKVFMYDLINGFVKTEEILDMWSQRLPSSFSGGFRLCVIKSRLPNVKSVQKYFFDLFESMHFRHIEIVANNMLYILLYAIDSKNRLNLNTAEIQKELKKFHALAGISDQFSDIIKFNVYMEQANAALEVGELLAPGNGMFYYDNYRLSYLLHTAGKYIDEKNIFAPGIAKLAQYDKEYGTEYLKTLELYVLENRNGSIVIETLGIHRNTLLYRLKKIEELLAISLENGETFAHYYISFFMIKMKNGGTIRG